MSARARFAPSSITPAGRAPHWRRCPISPARAARKLGVRFIALGEPEYPPALRASEEAPPPILAFRGREEALQQPAIAIVGSRNASAAGLAFADRLARRSEERRVG